MVDFICISYNQAPYVKECLDSIKNQTVGGYGIIFIDNASEDQSADIAEQWFAEQGVIPKKMIRSPENLGICKGLNLALQYSDAAFVKIIAADDYLAPTYLAECLEVFKTSDADIIYTNARRVDESGKDLEDSYYITPDSGLVPDMLNTLYRRNMIAAPSVILRREVYEKIGFYDADSFLEDYDFWLRAAKHGLKFYHLPETLTYYRVVSSGITVSKKFKVNDEKTALMIRHDAGGNFAREIGSSMIALSADASHFQNSKSLAAYQGYSGKNKLLHRGLTCGWSHTLLKIINKILS